MHQPQKRDRRQPASQAAMRTCTQNSVVRKKLAHPVFIGPATQVSGTGQAELARKRRGRRRAEDRLTR